MVAIKAKYEDGRITLPPDLPRRPACEVTILFPDETGGARPRDRELMRSAAGGWADMDTERLKRDIYEARKISTRKPPKL